MNKILPSLVILIISLGIFLGFSVVEDNPNGSRRQEPIQFESIPLSSPHYVAPDAIIFEDSLDGANDTTALKSRGYLPFYRGTGPQGLTATWFQGNNTVFPSFNGPPTGYVAANYNVVTGANNIDSWLILPVTPVGAGDTLSFYERGPTGSTYPDSMRIMYSASGSTTPEGTWVELGRFKNNITNVWTQHIYTAPAAGPTGRFALRYCVVNGGPSGTNSDYIGVDWIRVYGSGAGPTTCNYIAGTWCPSGTYPNILGATYFGAADWIGDTLYFHRPSTTGAGTTTIDRYTFGGTWTVGVPLPTTRTGGSMTTCNGKLYYIGGGATTVTAGTNTCYEYDPSTGAWTSKATMPASLAAHSSVCWGDSVIFVVGGPYSGSATNLNVHYYRVGSNTWGTITNSLPTGQGRRAYGLGISGNKIVMAAGYNTTYLKSTYVGTIGSDATSITWVAGPNVPTTYAGLSRPGGTALGDFFYLVGGEQAGGGYHTTTYVYSVPNNTWFGTITPMPHGRSNIFNSITARCFDDTVRVFSPGGYSGSAQNFFDVTGCGSILVNVTPTPETPKSYNLSQNHPNPFNPTTKINYSIPTSGMVTLKVYDILGKEVATLVNEVKAPGSYIVEFNGSNLSSGTYFYRLESEDFVAVKKMMFIK